MYTSVHDCSKTLNATRSRPRYSYSISMHLTSFIISSYFYWWASSKWVMDYTLSKIAKRGTCFKPLHNVLEYYRIGKSIYKRGFGGLQTSTLARQDCLAILYSFIHFCMGWYLGIARKLWPLRHLAMGSGQSYIAHLCWICSVTLCQYLNQILLLHNWIYSI